MPKPSSIKAVKGWAIVGGYGFYSGFWFTRKDAIYSHCRDKGNPWGLCQAMGDQVIKVLITPLSKKAPKRNKSTGRKGAKE
jgi:hypothetical protein